MKNKMVALIGIIFGGLFLSFELYLLKIVQFIDKSTGSWFEDIWEYAKMPPCSIALLITVAVIAFSFYIFLTSKDCEK
jgi:hypothetical protein